MGFLSHLLFPWGLLLQVFAIIHFIRRRPDMFWIYIILFLGPLGALVYIVVEVLPTWACSGSPSRCFRAASASANSRPRFATIRRRGITRNSAILHGGRQARASASSLEKAIAARADTLDPFYRRGVCAILLGDAAAAIPDLERAVTEDPDYDFYRAAGLLAHAYAQTGKKRKPRRYFGAQPSPRHRRRPI